MSSSSKYKEVIDANILVHSELVKKGEYQKSPHFKTENANKVKSKLTQLISNLPSNTKKKMVDFGCGTGFIINLIHDHFYEVHGVDVTKEMMKHVDLSPGNITLHESFAEKTNFSDNSFDFATAYSFMDHLLDYRDFLKEVYRTLKKGGIFYTGLNPNKDFILGMENAEKSISLGSPIVNLEIEKALHNGEYYKENFGLNSRLLEQAEPTKTFDKGFDFKEVLAFAKSVGFSKTEVKFEWFLGQAQVSKKKLNEVNVIDDYLQSILPFSSFCFKYLSFIFTK
jgi:2-polyprenyl-3-methyl-5-hydroxy-6-metoxy-1,4-benzoquinol methylase